MYKPIFWTSEFIYIWTKFPIGVVSIENIAASLLDLTILDL